MNITPDDIQNLHTLKLAFDNWHVGLVSYQLAETGEVVPVICAINRFPDGHLEFVPFAQLFQSDPRPFLNPPRENGVGFVSQAEQRGELN